MTQNTQNNTNRTPRSSQQTVAKPMTFCGLSLFHGYESTLRILPAEPDTGIVFRRVDLGPETIAASVENVLTVPRRTAIGRSEKHRVETIEHVMSAFAGLQVDNCIVEVNCPEVPAFDGSCRELCDSLLDVGVVNQGTPVQQHRTDEILHCQSSDGRQSMMLRPYLYSCPAITYHFDYGARAPVPPQVYSIEITPDTFYREIASARTFILEREIKALKAMGFGQHLTYRDLVVVDDHGKVIENELRWANEGTRHKILDCLGDLALSGMGFHGHVTACRSGHHLNHQMAQLIKVAHQKRRSEQAA